MNLKTLSFTTLTLAAALSSANAYFYAGFRIYKEYRQKTSGAPVFRTGTANMFAIDGSWTYTARCILNGQSTPFPVTPLSGCNIGSNGVLVRPTGSAIAPSFYEILGVEAASTIEVGRPDLVTLDARPTLNFPLSTSGLIQSSPIWIYYNLQDTTGDVREYRLGSYNYPRTYSSREEMEREIIQGVYRFKFPVVGQPTRSLYLNLPVKTTVEGYVEKPIRGGFRFTNVGPASAQGFAEYDRNVVNVFSWEGLNGNVIAATDKLYISFRGMSSTTDPDAAASGYNFPVTGAGFPILLPSPVQSSYSLPPGFFANGQVGLVELTIERSLGQGVGVNSSRVFQLPIKFVNTFTGSMLAAFPSGTDASLMAKNADPDGDGVSNWLEWLSGTDPTKANAPSALSAMTYVPPSTRRSGQTVPGYWFMSVDRRADLPESVKVTVESSTDMKNWSTIPNDDPNWIVEDIRSEPRIRILSRTADLPPSGRQFRVKYVDPS